MSTSKTTVYIIPVGTEFYVAPAQDGVAIDDIDHESHNHFTSQKNAINEAARLCARLGGTWQYIGLKDTMNIGEVK